MVAESTLQLIELRPAVAATTAAGVGWGGEDGDRTLAAVGDFA